VKSSKLQKFLKVQLTPSLTTSKGTALNVNNL
jgi:hypothetical protein